MISAFGVDHDGVVSKRQRDPDRENKAFGSAGKTAVVVGGTAAAVMGRRRANAVGFSVGERMANRARWSADRAQTMPGALRRGRLKYAGKLDAAAKKGPLKNQDVREWTGRTVVGGTAGTVAGSAVYGRKKLTPKENR